MKLSQAQQRVVNRLQEGWSLGWTTGIRPTAYLFKKGGAIEKVALNTFLSLRTKLIIRCVEESFPRSIYVLTEYANRHPTDNVR